LWIRLGSLTYFALVVVPVVVLVAEPLVVVALVACLKRPRCTYLRALKLSSLVQVRQQVFQAIRGFKVHRVAQE
jgi:hypothetical protein